MTKVNKITGKVTDAFLCKPLPNVKITVKDVDKNILSTAYTYKYGEWELSLSENAYSFKFEKLNYVSKEIVTSEDFPRLVRMLEDNLIGYQNKLWFYPGEEVTAFVHSNSNFNAKLVKHGLNNKDILNLGSFPDATQNVPDGFFVDRGLDWKDTIKYKIPDDAETGLYSLKLTTDKGAGYSITFVVQPKTDQDTDKKILVLASSNNWQTYNVWGGRSRYRNFENPKSAQLISNLKTLGLRFAPENLKTFIKKILRKYTVVSIKNHPNASQFRPLSIRRPHPNCSISEESVMDQFTSHLAAGEWRVTSWLEREGFKYDMISGYELHHNPDILKNYDVFILSTHSEYWSKEMFNTLKQFYNNGGSILNLSGNSIYREVEFLDNGNLRCTSLRFTDSAEDESQVIIVRFDMRGYGNCAPYKIIKADHWVFNGTNLRKGDLFAQHSLNHHSDKSVKHFDKDPASSPGMAILTGDGGSGWETDKITATAPKDSELLAKGTNNRGGGADMVIRESCGKGIMFSASSITFGGTLLIDENCSKIVKNVLIKALSKNQPS